VYGWGYPPKEPEKAPETIWKKGTIPKACIQKSHMEAWCGRVYTLTEFTFAAGISEQTLTLYGPESGNKMLQTCKFCYDAVMRQKHAEASGR
jgi:hypothetical protein